jgi:hypothetical protein
MLSNFKQKERKKERKLHFLSIHKAEIPSVKTLIFSWQAYIFSSLESIHLTLGANMLNISFLSIFLHEVSRMYSQTSRSWHKQVSF